MTTSNKTYLAELFRQLDRCFDLEEILTICFELNVDYENLPGASKSAMIRGLVRDLSQKGRLSELVTLAESYRPHLTWASVPTDLQYPAQLSSTKTIEFTNQFLHLDDDIGDEAGDDNVPFNVSEAKHFRPREHVRFRAVNFIGRQIQLLDLSTAVKNRHSNCLFALRGMGGIGKTALAAEIAALVDDARRFPGGILWANLATETPSNAAARWLENYGIDATNMSEDACLARLASILSSHPALVVLDNVQNTSAARKLLIKHPHVATLLTTRKRMAIPTEVKVIKVEELKPNESLMLLGEIIGEDRVNSELHAAESLCHLCGHLPLSVTLAGSQLANSRRWKTLDHYREVLEHQRLEVLSKGQSSADNIRITFDISYRELSYELKSLFDSLALFKGADFTLQAAVNATKSENLFTKNPLETLVDLSLLIRHGTNRYRLHDLLREYAEEKLGLRSDADNLRWQQQLLLYYRDFAGAKDADYDALDLEKHNILGVLDCSVPRDQDEWAFNYVKLVLSLSQYLKRRGLWQEATKIGNQAYKLAERLDLSEEQAELATSVLSWMYFHQGNMFAAQNWAKKGLDLYEESNDKRGLAYAARRWGMALIEVEDFDSAYEILTQALSNFRQLGISEKYGDTLTVLGYLERKRGNPSLAQQHLDEALSTAQANSDEKEISMTLYQMGRLAYFQGNRAEAIKLHDRSLEIDNSLKRKPGIAWNSLRLGQLMYEFGQFSQARNRLEEAQGHFDDMGVTDRVGQIFELLQDT